MDLSYTAVGGSSRPRADGKYLERGRYMPVEEDDRFEFKMHTTFSEDELPEWIRKSPQSRKESTRHRRQISRNINAFLNSGNGGTIYLGIHDDAMIGGLHLSVDQKEHLEVALEDVLIRYSPPIPSSLYQMSFIPVVQPRERKEPSSTVMTAHQWKPTTNTASNVESFCKPHLVRTDRCCWCFKMSRTQREKLPLFVVQVSIKPVLKRKGSIVRQLYLDEQGKCYFRRSASVWPCTYSELIRRTKEEVAEYYLTKDRPPPLVSLSSM